MLLLIKTVSSFFHENHFQKMNSSIADFVECRPEKRNLEDSFDTLNSSKKSKSSWKTIKNENLDLSYMSSFLGRTEARDVFIRLENEVEYFTGDLAKVRVFGKWHDLPRQQV